MTKEARIFRIISSVMFVLLIIISGTILYDAYGIRSVAPWVFLVRVVIYVMVTVLSVGHLMFGFKKMFKEEHDFKGMGLLFIFGLILLVVSAMIMFFGQLYALAYQVFGLMIGWEVFSSVRGKYLAIRPSFQSRYLAHYSARE